MTLPPRPVVRDAADPDAAPIAAIYNAGIRDRTATFETTERTADDVAAWLAERQDTGRPFLVALHDASTVVGWVRASAYRSRPCYASIAEFSIYVAREARGQRVGDVLMTAFLVACEASGLTKLVSRIFPENVASRALCRRHGFREVGTYERHGQLDGVWRDVIIVERLFPRNMR
jgi:L-amino acid N-acyltransferase YncA